MNRFVTLKTYASLCGVQRESLYKRLKAGTLSYTPYCEMPAIDVEQYPPARHKSERVTRVVTIEPYFNKLLPNWVYENRVVECDPILKLFDEVFTGI